MYSNYVNIVTTNQWRQCNGRCSFVLLTTTGETIKIVIEDYVQHLSQYNFKLAFNPELLFGVPYQYQNRIALEFNHLYHWHPLLPEDFNISGTTYPMKKFMFNSQLVVDHGMYKVIDSMSRQRAGKVSEWVCYRGRHCSTRQTLQISGKFWKFNILGLVTYRILSAWTTFSVERMYNKFSKWFS